MSREFSIFAVRKTNYVKRINTDLNSDLNTDLNKSEYSLTSLLNLTGLLPFKLNDKLLSIRRPKITKQTLIKTHI